jgi:catechol 2,3-dioxygenase-like lactoylglutathione lyase family enzyme
MRLIGLDHMTVRCRLDDLPAVRAFWCDVLGLTEGDRPGFSFPGAWLYLDGRPVVHLVATRPDDLAATGAPIDHVAFNATGLAAARARLNGAGIAFREQSVPGRAMTQLFVHDPAGTRIEILFDLGNEGDAA